MSAAPQTPVGRITILCAAFVVFAGNASGLLEFSLHSGIDLRSAMLISPLDGTVMLPPAMRSAEFLVLLACGALLSALLPMLSPVRGAMLAATTVIAPFATYLAAPAGRAYLLEYTLLMIAVLYFLHVLCSYFVETQSKQKIVRIFGQYVPPSLVSEISRQPDALDLEGEARRLTVFFCDIQDFSAIAEQLNPRQLARLLNEYFTQMTEILFRHGATIDKYIGDSIMAFWGAPLAQPDHARRAVLASFEMHREIERLGAEFAKRGWPGPAMGIGANTGIMNVGDQCAHTWFFAKETRAGRCDLCFPPRDRCPSRQRQRSRLRSSRPCLSSACRSSASPTMPPAICCSPPSRRGQSRRPVSS